MDIYSDSVNWWKFIDVLDTFIFDRGLKEEDVRSGEVFNLENLGTQEKGGFNLRKRFTR